MWHSDEAHCPAPSAAARTRTRTWREPRTSRVQVGGPTTVPGRDKPQDPHRGQGQAPDAPREAARARSPETLGRVKSGGVGAVPGA